MEKEIKNRFEKLEKRLGKVEGFFSKDTLSKNGVFIKCYHCGNAWLTRSRNIVTSCSCGQKVNIQKGIENARK